MMDLEELKKTLEPELVFSNELLANHTTLRIGGPADVLYRARTTKALVKAVRAAKKLNIPVTMLGWGSNVLIGDKGIRGVCGNCICR